MHTSIVLIALAGTAWRVQHRVHGGQLARGLHGGVARRPRRPQAPGRFRRQRKPWLGRDEQGGAPTRAARDLLRSEYVCVYVDRDRRAGRELAESFEMGDGPGLVLSDRRGDSQAFRHEGTLDDDALERQLRKYSDPDRVVRRTETGAVATTSYYAAPAAPVPVYAPAGRRAAVLPGAGDGRLPGRRLLRGVLRRRPRGLLTLKPSGDGSSPGTRRPARESPAPAAAFVFPGAVPESRRPLGLLPMREPYLSGKRPAPPVAGRAGPPEATRCTGAFSNAARRGPRRPSWWASSAWGCCCCRACSWASAACSRPPAASPACSGSAPCSCCSAARWRWPAAKGGASRSARPSCSSTSSP